MSQPTRIWLVNGMSGTYAEPTRWCACFRFTKEDAIAMREVLQRQAHEMDEWKDNKQAQMGVRAFAWSVVREEVSRRKQSGEILDASFVQEEFNTYYEVIEVTEDPTVPEQAR